MQLSTCSCSTTNLQGDGEYRNKLGNNNTTSSPGCLLTAWYQRNTCRFLDTLARDPDTGRTMNPPDGGKANTPLVPTMQKLQRALLGQPNPPHVAARHPDTGRTMNSPERGRNNPLRPSRCCGILNLLCWDCLLYTSPSPRDRTRSRMPSSA